MLRASIRHVVMHTTCVVAAFLPSASYAYIGPGAGLSAIGAFLALIAAVAVAIFGFVWYPLKRLARRRKQMAKSPGASGDEQSRYPGAATEVTERREE